MATLEDHPDVYGHFVAGHHVIRQSDCRRGGVSTNLVIEQCHMHSLQSSNGLTREVWKPESQRLTWVVSMSVCAKVNSAMQYLTEVRCIRSDQHKEATTSQIEGDIKDTKCSIRGFFFFF